MRFCPLYSGSSGNATLVEAGDVRLLIDAGLPGRTVENALRQCGVDPCTLSAILVTHEHRDHIGGVGVLSRRYSLPVYANAGTWAGMQPITGEIAPKNTRVFETNRDFYIKNVNILPFKTPHDANESVGYVINCGGVMVSVMTDVGHVSERMLAAVQGSDIILIEANHDVEMLKAGSYPYPLKRRILGDNGHLSNENAGMALCKLYREGVKHAVLGHLSKDNNYEALAMETVRSVLREDDIVDELFALAIAHRDRPTGMFEIGG
ncbi:MAG: MBL fold metallo-hydrolase [Clostridia bacterium]